MSTIVEAGLPADQFALEHSLAEVPGAEFEVFRLVANEPDRIMPFVWGTAEDLDALSDAVEADPTTEDVEVLSELEEEYLFRMTWMARIRVILHIILEENGTIMDAYGADGRWELRILFPEHDSVSTTHEFCEDYDIDLGFERVYQLSDSVRRGQYGLTDDQYETITRAYELGYYEVPRETTLDDLADDRDVTHQALSERLRRGHATLIENTLRPEFGGRDAT
ncbi:MAG: putative DNA binding protein [Natronomonas sp.]|jgi:predicted DNA binding protein